jgi:hypothetical protein
LGYPTPVNPDQPRYAPLGKWWRRSFGWQTLSSIDARPMRDRRAAETLAVVAIVRFRFWGRVEMGLDEQRRRKGNERAVAEERHGL